MKFYISRTSDGNFNEETPPIDVAKGEKVSYIAKFYDGTSREVNRTAWPIEIKDLDALMDLVRKEGKIVIDIQDCIYKFGPRIIIYDDYLE